jgi:uncharacterized protein (TIGR03435 family)
MKLSGAGQALMAAVTVSALVTQRAWCQVPSASSPEPKFEVASIRPNKSGDGSLTINTNPGGRFDAVNAPLQLLVLAAYRLQDFQLVDVPDWLGTTRFDIRAKAEKEITYDEARPMLQSLLAERFGLRVHRETRDLPIYALVVARADGKLGPELAKAEIDCTNSTNRNPSVQLPIPCGVGTSTMNGAARMRVGSTPISTIVFSLSPFVHRMVVDRTGLIGPYNGTLSWSVNQAPEATGASIFTALQEQLGLKLESSRGPVEVLVIDHVEQPTPD